MDCIRKAVLASLMFALAPASLPAAQQWVKLTSANFDLYTTAGEKRGREAVLHFEQVRSFFLKVGIKDPSDTGRVRIIAFQSVKEYEPYRPNESAFAYYLGGADKDYIVMQSLGSSTYPVAIHEYVHLLVRHSGVKLPVWLNEGLADLYSTLEPVAKKVKVGLMDPGRLAVMSQKKMLDLETLMSVDQDSPYYNERNRVDIFYAESWALVHMMQLSDAYRPKYPEFIRELTSGTPPAETFQKVYGKTLAQVQKELNGYIRASSYSVAIFDTQLEKASENPQVQVAPPAEVGLSLADLLSAHHKEEEADQLLLQLDAQNPNSAEIAEARGYFALRKRQSLEEVRPLFEKAVQLGSANPKLYYDYAMLMGRSGEEDGQLVRLLQKAIELQPDFLKARLALATALYNQHLYAQAIANLSSVQQVDHEDAVRMFRMLAYSYNELGMEEAARKAAERLREISKTEEEIALADDLMQYVSQPLRPPVEQPAASSPSAERAGEPRGEERPRLARRSAPVSTFTERSAPQPPRVRIEATLFQFDCLGDSARLTVLFHGSRVSFAILDPNTITIKGASSGTLDFSCGRQQPVPVIIEFEDKVDGKLGTTGIVRSIEFK